MTASAAESSTGAGLQPCAGKKIPRRAALGYVAAAALAVLMFALCFGRDLTLPGLYMDSINPEYFAVKSVVEGARPDTPTLVLPGNIIAGKYPVLAGSYYHGPLQFYVALPIYAVLGADIVSARIVQGLYGVLILLSMAWVAQRYSIRPAIAAGALVLLALDPAFSLAFKTQAYNVLWPLVWLFLAIGATESWAGRGDRPRAAQLVRGGFFLGVSFFCYFVFLFFVPALAAYLMHCLREVGVRDRGRILFSLMLCGIGFCLGGAGYLVGYQLAANESGGWRAFISNNRAQVHALAVDDRLLTLPERLDRASHSMMHALSDNWVSRTMLQVSSESWLGKSKALLLIAVPILLLVVLRRSRIRSRLLELCLALSALFFVASLFFGNKIAGHHFTLLVPLLYLGIAAGLSDAWPVFSRTSRRAPTAILAVCALLFAADSAVAQSGFSRTLRETGGVGYFSDAINRYAEHANSNSVGTVHYLPEWGLSMPFIFLTGGRIETGLFEPTPDVIARRVCNGSAVEVAYMPIDSGRAFVKRARKRRAELMPSFQTYKSRDGRSMIGVAAYSPPKDRAGRAACESYRPQKLSVWKLKPEFRIHPAPAEIKDCSMGSVTRVRLDWDVTASNAKSVAIWVSSDESRSLWMTGTPVGSSTTGPWMRSGAQFEIQDEATGERLATAKIGGVDCR